MSPIPFKALDPPVIGGTIGFLRIESAGRGLTRGGLLMINALGEPQSFTYNQVETRHPFLWRNRNPTPATLMSLIRSIFEMCVDIPDLIVYRLSEINPDFFVHRIMLEVPVAGLPEPPNSQSDEANPELSVLPDPDIIWTPRDAVTDAHIMELCNRLMRGGLLYEPFERIAVGLKETYSDNDSEST